MKELEDVLDRFTAATGTPVVVWSRASGWEGSPITAQCGRMDVGAPPVIGLLAPGGPFAQVETAAGPMAVAAVNESVWVGIGLAEPQAVGDAVPQLDLLLPIVGHYFQSAREMEHTALQLAARYEEINLLYTTSEILGHTVSLEEAASRILAEISETVNARRAAILVHDRVTDTLQVVCAQGFDPAQASPISASDPASVAALAFRELRARMVAPLELPCAAEQPLRAGPTMAIPILWTSPGPDGAVPLGVVTLSDRRSGEPFSASEERLVTAIATQIGTAIQNARLVRASLAQQKHQQEMRLASDLQMKLLPDPALYAPEARVAARVLPAESVGGDFYHLFRLSGGRTGVMIGDVASHGYRAALVMAQVMSAASVHAQSTADPAEMLDALLGTLRDELASTEMFVSLFYAVLDPGRSRVRYANAGHPHAFIVNTDGSIERLGALDPPLGMSTDSAAARERYWDATHDMLLLFTDGVSDARNRQGARLGEQPLLDVVKAIRHEEPEQILERAFATVRTHMKGALQRDDLTLMVARSG